MPRSPSLGVFCGRETPDDVIQSSGNVMAVHFRSDRGLIGRGFQATYTSNEPAGLSVSVDRISTSTRKEAMSRHFTRRKLLKIGGVPIQRCALGFRGERGGVWGGSIPLIIQLCVWKSAASSSNGVLSRATAENGYIVI